MRTASSKHSILRQPESLSNIKAGVVLTDDRLELLLGMAEYLECVRNLETGVIHILYV